MGLSTRYLGSTHQDTKRVIRINTTWIPITLNGRLIRIQNMRWFYSQLGKELLSFLGAEYPSQIQLPQTTTHPDPHFSVRMATLASPPTSPRQGQEVRQNYVTRAVNIAKMRGFPVSIALIVNGYIISNPVRWKDTELGSATPEGTLNVIFAHINKVDEQVKYRWLGAVTGLPQQWQNEEVFQPGEQKKSAFLAYNFGIVANIVRKIIYKLSAIIVKVVKWIIWFVGWIIFSIIHILVVIFVLFVFKLIRDGRKEEL